jgi:hypothetical protein
MTMIKNGKTSGAQLLSHIPNDTCRNVYTLNEFWCFTVIYNAALELQFKRV